MARTKSRKEIAVFGGGCFWCTEAVFSMIAGVTGVASGYAGGTLEEPGYEEVSTGGTGHAEVVRIEYDPSKITYRDLLDVFFAAHDPTTPNRQGNDVGSQYRSVVLYVNDEQRKLAETYIAELAKEIGAPVVTELVPFNAFYPAEDAHKDYYSRNREAPYCRAVIDPKLAKVRERFAALLRKEGTGH